MRGSVPALGALCAVLLSACGGGSPRYGPLPSVQGAAVIDASEASHGNQRIMPPSNDGVYLGAWGNPQIGSPVESIAQLESDVGRKLAFHVAWSGLSMPQLSTNPAILDDIANGRAPLLSWNCSSSAGYTFAGIAAGTYDSILDADFAEMKALGVKLFVRPAWEANLNLGNPPFNPNNDNCFASTGLSNQAAEFVAYWRHLVDRARQDGVKNVTWVWCMAGGPIATIDAAHITALYPGREYVDWIGYTAYDRRSVGAVGTLKPFYDFVRSWGKPIMVAETGELNSAGPCGRNSCVGWTTQQAYLSELQSAVKRGGALYPGVHAVGYFNACAQGCSLTSWNWVLDAASGIPAMATLGADPYFSPMVR